MTHYDGIAAQLFYILKPILCESRTVTENKRPFIHFNDFTDVNAFVDIFF